MLFFLYQNITKICITTMQSCIYKTRIKIYCINFIFSQFCFSSKTGWKKHLSLIEQQRLDLVMNSSYLRLTVFILYFYNFLTLAFFNLGGSTKPPEPPPRSATESSSLPNTFDDDCSSWKLISEKIMDGSFVSKKGMGRNEEWRHWWSIV